MFQHLAARHFFDIRVSMARQSVISQKKRGPPPTGKGAPILVRMQPPLLANLDVWIAKQDAALTRPGGDPPPDRDCSDRQIKTAKPPRREVDDRHCAYYKTTLIPASGINRRALKTSLTSDARLGRGLINLKLPAAFRLPPFGPRVHFPTENEVAKLGFYSVSRGVLSEPTSAIFLPHAMG